MSEPPATAGRLPVSADHTARLSSLFETHEERLYRLARRLTPTIDDALDLVQETFVKAARAVESIPAVLQEEEAWLVRVLVNVRRDQWRRERVRKRQAHTREPAPVQDAGDPETSFVIRTAVRQALDSLPPRRRAVVTMADIEGLDTTAIASLLGISVITVRWHLAQGRRQLARLLTIHLGDSHESSEQSLAGRRPNPSRSTTP
jgi:RNA polymerase sigma-70 factor (ECF subfamily)